MSRMYQAIAGRLGQRTPCGLGLFLGRYRILVKGVFAIAYNHGEFVGYVLHEPFIVIEQDFSNCLCILFGVRVQDAVAVVSLDTILILAVVRLVLEQDSIEQGLKSTVQVALGVPLCKVSLTTVV